MSQPEQMVTIKIEIQIPVGTPINLTTSQVHASGPETKTTYAPPKTIRGGLGFALEDAGAIFVKPNPNDLGYGTICYSKTFGTETKHAYARVYPGTNPAPTDPQDPVGEGAVEGHRTGTSNKFDWNPTDSQMIPRAQHSVSPGTINTLLLWRRQCEEAEWKISTVEFKGVTGTNTDCGVPVGSNPGFLGSQAKRQPSTFPAFWSVEIIGFTGLDAIFNSLHALLADRNASNMVWTNHADGVKAPKLSMTYDSATPKWTLKAQYGAQGFTAVSSCPGPFGPLTFKVAEGQEAGTQITAMIP